MAVLQQLGSAALVTAASCLHGSAGNMALLLQPVKPTEMTLTAVTDQLSWTLRSLSNGQQHLMADSRCHQHQAAVLCVHSDSQTQRCAAKTLNSFAHCQRSCRTGCAGCTGCTGCSNCSGYWHATSYSHRYNQVLSMASTCTLLLLLRHI